MPLKFVYQLPTCAVVPVKVCSLTYLIYQKRRSSLVGMLQGAKSVARRLSGGGGDTGQKRRTE